MASDSYFSFFGNVTINNISIKNIFKSINFIVDKFSNKQMYINHRVIDGQTPESLAAAFYNNKELFWLILVCNNMKDYHFDWPLRDEEIRLSVDKIYNSGVDTGITKDQLYEELTEENEAKRNIRYFNPEYISDLIFEINKKI